MDQQLKINLIILNWNGKEDTLECLASVEKIIYPNYSVIVADNGSTDDSVAAIRNAYPDVFILENGANLGFAEGNNRAISYALNQGADAVVLLNNDVVVDPGLLQAFNDAYHKLAEPGILGTVSFYYDQPSTIWAAGGNWNYKHHEQQHVGKNLTENSLPSKLPFEVEYVVGCAIFVHKKLISDIGLMDSIYFLNCEENDWCRRARKSGYKIYTIPAAKIWHKVSSSFGGESPLWKYFMTRNQLLWASRYLETAEYHNVIKRILKEFFPLFPFTDKAEVTTLKTIYWGSLSWLKQLKLRSQQPFYQAQFYGMLHYVMRRFGDCPPHLKAKLTKPDQ